MIQTGHQHTKEMYVWKIAKVSWLFTLLAININSVVSFGEKSNSEYHTMIHSQGDPCNVTEQCLTLSQFVNNISDYLSENMTLNFLPGEHILDSALLIKNINSFYMGSLDSNVTITCSHSGNFEFSNTSVVHISGLTFIACTGNKLVKISQFTLEESELIGNGDVNIGGTALELIETSAKLIRTEFSNNYCSRVTSLLCESGNNYYAEKDFLYNINRNENVYVSATAGGAIVSSHSNVTIIGSVFEGNSAQAGGAIFAELQSNTTIINSTFVGNQATSIQSHQYCYAGGGVLYSINGSFITIESSTFVHNTAHWIGGVIATGIQDSIITDIKNSDFASNFANYFGGVLSSGDYSNITITDSAFTNNSVYVSTSSGIYISTIASTAIISSGGVIHLFVAHYSIITITGSAFINNFANNSGGVLFLNGDTDYLSNMISMVTIIDSEFINNSANYDGGVLWMFDIGHSNITITNSAFTRNVAFNHGGIITVCSIRTQYLPITITISHSNFANNSAAYGGIVAYCWNFFQVTIINIMNTSFVYNKADKTGGVLTTRSYTDVIITVAQSTFIGNEARDGGTIHTSGGNIIINCSQFHHNTARLGGVMWSQYTNIKSHDTNLTHNKAYTDGGALYAQNSNMTLTGTYFSHNRADNNGGVMFTDRAVTSNIINCKFHYNTAGNDGGVMRSYLSVLPVNIIESVYSSNGASNDGGVFHIDQTNLVIHQTSFTHSKAKDGGVIWSDQGDLELSQCDFVGNNASAGGTIWAEQARVHVSGVNINMNHANVGAVYLLESNSNWSDILYSDNIGSLYAFGGIVTISDSNLTDNVQPSYRHPLLKEGGTITAVQCETKFEGKLLLSKGRAEHGGALKAIESKIHVHGNVTIANNRATEAGGGIYLYHSELTCWKNSALNIVKNVATKRGGGISATGSVIKLKGPLLNQSFSSLAFDSNKALNGGGLFLEMDSKVYIFKSKYNTSKQIIGNQRLVSFSMNSALKYGGAIYVSDNGMCSVSKRSTVNECFIQTLAMYAPMSADFDPEDARCQNIVFVNNTAKLSGNSLFGGLLDRCTVSQFAETNINNVNMDFTFSNGTMIVEGYEYFQKISNVQDTDVGSPPIRVCFCINGQPSCSHQHDPIQVRKGQQEIISLSLAIVNQIHDSLQEATILSHFHSGNYVCQSHTHSIDGSCSNVEFAVSSNNDTEELILSLDEGPCKDEPESKARVMIGFFCPQCLIGFELDEGEEGCRCVCDSQLFPYFTNCSGEILIREQNVWISNLTTFSHTSDTHQYLIHPNCPFDYCHPPSSRVEINLNIPNGADAQCANHRAGLLCGECQYNFSLSLGSSHCLPCSTHWYAVLIAILIAAVLAGMALVALLLTLNLTVATGTLNGIIFYANIVYANNSVLLPFTEPFNFVTAFISWLNLEIGFDTCFFAGMDAYSKTLLQLVFPGYVFFLVFMVIIIGKHSMRFSQLIGKCNPVATLATLISLSYAKFLHITIASLSYAVLKYPDGSRAYVWLVDASVGYLSGKHMALFIVALLIIIAGVCYTALLLFWQWLLRHQDKMMFKWTKYQKLCHFLEPYHAPYVDKHRYWAGLLFLVRVVLYTVFALNVNGNPHVSLVAIILTIGGLLLTKGFLVKVYKKWPIDVMESIMYFNILGFAALIWYFIETPQRQRAIAYTSVTITLIFLLMVIAFHVYKFTPLGSVIQKTKIFKVLAAKLVDNNEIVDKNPIKPEHRKQEVTFSVVEIPKPILERPEPEIHIQMKPQELPCYTPVNTLEEQESKCMQDCNKKCFL